MTYGHGFGMGVWFFFSWIITAVVIVFAIYGLMMLLKKTETHEFHWKKKPKEELTKQLNEAPLDILKARLAKGEITREEFLSLKDDILNN